MTRREIGVVALAVVLMATLAGCAGEKRSTAAIRSSLRLQAQKEARKAMRKAETKAREQENVGPGPEPSRILKPGAAHPTAATIALKYVGVPYVWGGASPRGFDNSGLVKYVYARLGISLPHYTVSQWNVTAPISRSHLKPGDLVFFDGLERVGIYIGDGRFVEAPHTGSVTRVESLAAWRGSFDGARRVL